MPATSVRSASSGHGGARVKPHILGGSNNLMSERQRREKAETALLKTKESLQTVKMELAPQLEQLFEAIKTIQIEKHHQLDLDEASQEVLEGLQVQMNELEERQQQFPDVITNSINDVLKQIQEQAVSQSYKFKLEIDELQSAQDEYAAELRLVHHEFVASREYLATRINAVEDAMEGLRSEMSRATERHQQAHECHSSKLGELDEKLFATDKELLKLKLALPSSVAAQLPTASTTGSGSLNLAGSAGLAVSQKLDELSAEFAALKSNAAFNRHADRKQIEALTNRLRETAKCNHQTTKELEGRLQEVNADLDQITSKVPSELSKRLLQAQKLWDADFQTLKSRVQHFETELLRDRQSEGGSYSKRANNNVGEHLDPEREGCLGDSRWSELENSLDELRADMYVARNAEEATKTASLARIMQLETDMLALYDWTRDKVGNVHQELAFASEQLSYLTRYAKILPK